MERLRQRADFLAAASGIKSAATAFVLQARKRVDDGPARFGFTVSKKVGNAVERNRVRRRLREIVRIAGSNRIRTGHDYVLIGRRAALKVPFARIAEDFEGALRRVHAGRNGNTGSAMTDNKNTILAIALSALVLIAWQFFFAMPQEKARQEKLQAEQLAQKQQAPTQQSQPGQPAQVPAQPGAAQVPGQAAAPAAAPVTRDAALAASPRVPIATDSLQGSIALKGGRIDDLALVKFRETVDPKSPPIVLLSPSGSPEPFYAEFGWTNAAGASLKVPTADTVWTQASSGALGIGHPVTLTYDNGEGLEFRRTIAVDDKYLFTIKDEVANKSDKAVSLFPFALISRHGTPKTLGYYILHEGLIGKFGDKGSEEVTYKTIEEKKESPITPPMLGWALPTSTGRPCCCPKPTPM